MALFVTLAAATAPGHHAWAQDPPDVRIVGGPPQAMGAEPIEHTVQAGDTLWDLCDSYYGDPWRWPAVWADNPQVSNPHYIYPGDVLVFNPIEEKPSAGGMAAFTPEPTGPRMIPTEPAIGGARVRFVPREWEHQVYVRYVGFVTEAEIRAAGVIRNSREERELLGELDEVYIDFERLPRVRPGDRWTILELTKDLYHPIYGRKIGTKVDILGVVDIRAVSRKVAMGVIVRSYKEIERGSLVTPLVPNFRSVKPRPNKVDVRGYVVDSYSGLENMGQHDFVYIDKGLREGVEVGNRFHVVRRGDGVVPLEGKALDRLPWEPFGEIMVVESREHHCTGVVIGNLEEIVIGDVVEMRVGF